MGSSFQKFLLWCIPKSIRGTRKNHLEYSREKVLKYVLLKAILKVEVPFNRMCLLTRKFTIGAWHRLITTTRTFFIIY